MKTVSRRSLLQWVAALPAWPQTLRQKFRAGVCAGSRDEAGFLKVCDSCAQAGLHHFETSGAGLRLVELYGGRVAQLKDQLQKRRLDLAGYAQYSHMSEPAKQQEVLQLHLQIGRFLHDVGGRYITQLWIPPPKPGVPDDQLLKHVTAEDYRNFGRQANEIGRRLRNEFGVRIGYHPEQEDVAAGLVDRVMEATDPRYFDFVPDVGHLTAGGLDPMQVYKRYRSRIIATHFRDWDPNAAWERDGKPIKGRFVPLGQGVIPLRALASYLEETSFDGQVNAEGGQLQANYDYLAHTLSLDMS